MMVSKRENQDFFPLIFLFGVGRGGVGRGGEGGGVVFSMEFRRSEPIIDILEQNL